MAGTRVFPERRRAAVMGGEESPFPAALMPRAGTGALRDRGQIFAILVSPTTLSGSDPEFRFEDPSETDPAGRWRLGVDADNFVIERKEAAGTWPGVSTDLYILAYSATNKVLYVNPTANDNYLSLIGGQTLGASILLYGTTHANNSQMSLRTTNAAEDGFLERIIITGGVTEAIVSFAESKHNYGTNYPTQTTVGAAGAASGLPAAPTGYLRIQVAGAERVIPFYLQA